MPTNSQIERDSYSRINQVKKLGLLLNRRLNLALYLRDKRKIFITSHSNTTTVIKKNLLSNKLQFYFNDYNVISIYL